MKKTPEKKRSLSDIVGIISMSALIALGIYVLVVWVTPTSPPNNTYRELKRKVAKAPPWYLRDEKAQNELMPELKNVFSKAELAYDRDLLSYLYEKHIQNGNGSELRVQIWYNIVGGEYDSSKIFVSLEQLKMTFPELEVNVEDVCGMLCPQNFPRRLAFLYLLNPKVAKMNPRSGKPRMVRVSKVGFKMIQSDMKKYLTSGHAPFVFLYGNVALALTHVYDYNRKPNNGNYSYWFRVLLPECHQFVKDGKAYALLSTQEYEGEYEGEHVVFRGSVVSREPYKYLDKSRPLDNVIDVASYLYENLH